MTRPFRNGGSAVSVDRKPEDIKEGEAHTLPVQVLVDESGEVVDLRTDALISAAQSLDELTVIAREVVLHLRHITGQDLEED